MLLLLLYVKTKIIKLKSQRTYFNKTLCSLGRQVPTYVTAVKESVSQKYEASGPFLSVYGAYGDKLTSL